MKDIFDGHQKFINKMISYKNLVIIGTSHVSKDSIKLIQDTITGDFSVVGIELDKGRLYSLLHPEIQKERISFSMVRRVGFKGFLFALLGKYVQEKIGRSLNTKPGSDMLEAYKQAKQKGIEIKLIDEDIEKVLQKISKHMRFSEKWRFVKDLVFSSMFPKKYSKKYGLENIDLSKVPSEELIEKMISAMRKDYPSIYKILVEDRNKLMAKRIYFLMQSYPRVLIVVGAGHEKEIIRLVDEFYHKNTDVF